MRVVLIGGNGQVASEVALILSGIPSIEVRPVARSLGGSAFLRYQGIRVCHGHITEAEDARRIQRGADVVANFALAHGSPAESMAANEAIIRQSFDSSPSNAIIVFFSTLAVRELLGSKRTLYTKLKLRNEQQVLHLAKKNGRQAYVLRLGHVAGEYQNISLLCRDQLSKPPVAIPDPGRLSNVVHTVTVADAIVAIGERRAGPPGLYDLVNVPQWTWRQVYSREADILGIPVIFEIRGEGSAPTLGVVSQFRNIAFAMIRNFHLKERLTAIAGSLPVPFNDRLRAEYLLDRARREIAALEEVPPVGNHATEWPALETRVLAGLTSTETLLASTGSLSQRRNIKRWPPDLADTV